MGLWGALAAGDRRLPFGTGTLVGATALGLVLSGGVAMNVKETQAARVEQAVSKPPANVGAKPKAGAKPAAPKPKKKPVMPMDFVLDVDEALPGWTQVPDGASGGGPMDLEDAAKVEAGGEAPTKEDRDALRELGFVRGHARAWRGDAGVMFVVFVYEWKSTKGPLTYVEGIKIVNEGKGGWQPRTPTSYGMCRIEGRHTSDGVLAAVGKRSYLMVTLRKGDCSTHEPVAALADRVAKHAKSLGS